MVSGCCSLSMLLNFSVSDFAGEALVRGEISLLIFLWFLLSSSSIQMEPLCYLNPTSYRPEKES